MYIPQFNSQKEAKSYFRKLLSANLYQKLDPKTNKWLMVLVAQHPNYDKKFHNHRIVKFEPILGEYQELALNCQIETGEHITLSWTKCAINLVRNQKEKALELSKV